MELQKVFVITMWSGGKPSRKWKSLAEPELLPQGTGLRFKSMDTQLTVSVIGSLSVEEFEQGDPATWFADSESPMKEDSEAKPRDDKGGGPELTVL